MLANLPFGGTFTKTVTERLGDPSSALNAWELATFMGKASEGSGNPNKGSPFDLQDWLKKHQTAVLASAAGLLVLAVAMRRR